MKAYRYIHLSLLVVSFIPMGLHWWPFIYCIIPPVVVIAIYALNEIVLSRKEDKFQGEASTLRNDTMLHAYREG
ncbi:hypothetical protein AL755_03205 (plasmid) [Arthrobacter sp. ERGS1:01]|nr:hypothetical protein AL755_03205 [Arthrobacter sp. ERGS1:01]